MTAAQMLTDADRIGKQLRLSHRHRSWCSNLPALDIDSDGRQLLDGLYTEYDNGIPVALIDYKSAGWDLDSNTRTLIRLAARANLPARMVEYWDGGDEPWCWRFRVSIVGLDAAGRPRKYEPQALTEKQYVRWLHSIRERVPGVVGCCSVMREALS